MENKYSPEIFDLELLDNKYVVITDYYWGNITCYDVNHVYITNWPSGFYESPRLKKIGTLVRPRWQKFKTIIVEDGYTYSNEK